MISERDFERIPIRIGKITNAKKHPKTDDIIILINIGHVSADKQVVVDLKETYLLESLIGQEVIYIETDQPIIVEGVESLGFILVTHKNQQPVLVKPDTEVVPGAGVVGLRNVEIGYHVKP